jgi:hypothetical protein
MTDDRPTSSDGWLEGLVRLSDDQFRLPGTNVRFGLDALLGLLLPGVGDAASTALAFAVVFVAWREAAPPALLGRMLFNVAVDTLGGSVPVLGDWFDLTFRANRKNYALLTQFRTARGKLPAGVDPSPSFPPDSGVTRRRGSALAFGVLALVLVLFILVPVTLTLLLGYWLWR